jgi:hypothetical protein
MERPRQLISVPVGADPRISKYRGGTEYLDYGYAPCRLYLTTSLSSLIEELTSWQKEYSNSYQHMEFREDRYCGCYHDCSCAPTYVLHGRRLETDLEYNWRIAQEDRINAEREQRERNEYERLQRKFANHNQPKD